MRKKIKFLIAIILMLTIVLPAASKADAVELGAPQAKYVYDTRSYDRHIDPDNYAQRVYVRKVIGNAVYSGYIPKVDVQYDLGTDKMIAYYEGYIYLQNVTPYRVGDDLSEE